MKINSLFIYTFVLMNITLKTSKLEMLPQK